MLERGSRWSAATKRAVLAAADPTGQENGGASWASLPNAVTECGKENRAETDPKLIETQSKLPETRKLECSLGRQPVACRDTRQTNNPAEIGIVGDAQFSVPPHQ